MRLEMGLYWCEVLIKGLLAKRVQQKLAPFGVGIAFTGSISALLLQSRYVDAAPCCTKANAVTSTSLSEASEESKNPIRNIQSLKETGGLEQDSSTVPTLPFENGYSPDALAMAMPKGNPYSTLRFLLRSTNTKMPSRQKRFQRSALLLYFPFKVASLDYIPLAP